MKVKFLIGFQGRETRNLWIGAGKVADLEEEMAILVVRNGQAEFVLDPEDFAALAAEAAGGERESLDELLEGVTPENIHPEVPVSKPKGKKRGGR
jgi:hypothetical protein